MAGSVWRWVRSPQIKPYWDFIVLNGLKAIGRPEWMSHLLFLGLKKEEKINSQWPTVLCLSRELFEKDLSELKNNTQLNWLLLESGYTKIQQIWTPQEIQMQTDYQSQSGESFTKAREKSLRLALTFIKKLNQKTPISAVMSGNIDYWQDQGFKQACQQLKIPFLVLCKEHNIIPKSIDEGIKWLSDHKYKFQGNGIAVAGITTKDVLLRAHVAAPENIWVTGFPRLDIWSQIDSSKPLLERKFITLLSYRYGYYADSHFREMVHIFVKESHKYPHHHFFIKCKNWEDVHEVKKIITNPESSGENKSSDSSVHLLPQSIPSNLEIQSDIPLTQLLPQSKLTLGFNSLSLVEALLARSYLAIPYWGECRGNSYDLMFDPQNSKINQITRFLNSPEEFSQLIELTTSNKLVAPSFDQMREVVNQFFYFDPQSTSSAQIEKFVYHYLKKITMA